MQKWLDNNISIYSTHNEGKSVVAKRFIKTLRDKTCTTMTANGSQSYLSYLIKLVDHYNNTYHCFICKNLVILIILLWLKELNRIFKTPKFKVGDRVRISKHKNIFSKGYTQNWSRETFLIDSVLKLVQ